MYGLWSGYFWKAYIRAFSQIRLTIRGIPADDLWISSNALAINTSRAHPE